MIPSGKTVVCGIIGDPVEHSMSPSMQNAAFQASGIDCVYVAFRVLSGELDAAAASVKALRLRGLNVTVPHKVDIMQYLDAIDPVAQRIGAVNTIVNDSGHLQGYNTDVAGFVHALTDARVNVAGEKVVVLGAGGGARAVAYSLADLGASIVILNRTVDRAESLTKAVAGDTGASTSYAPLTAESIGDHTCGAVLLVNTTSVGMSPHVDRSPCPAEMMRRDLAVCDIVYNPLRTRLIRDAEARGAGTISGVEMLVGQGARAFELWTGASAPLDVMRATVLEELSRGA